jgi:predicted metal-dependent peptidase
MNKKNTFFYQQKSTGGTWDNGKGTMPKSQLDLSELTKEEEAEQAERLMMGRVRLLLNKPFFGNLATRLIPVPTYKVPTAGTDGRRFFYNPAFLKHLTDNEVLFLCGHEVLHCVFDHFGRREGRNPQLYNMAGDYIINIVLADEQVGDVITTVPILLDYKYRDWTSEEVYDDLVENCKNPQETLDFHFDMDGEGEGDATSGQGPGEGDNEDGQGDVQKDLDAEFGGGALSDEEKKQLKDELKEAIIEAANQAGAGNTPAGIKRMIKEWTEPKMDWRSVIRAQVESCLKDDYTFMRPSRKSHSTNCILPGMSRAEKIEVACALDMSGSIGQQQATDFLSEVKGILDQYEDFELNVWCFDTEIYNHEKYTPDNADEIDRYQLQGGGGTSFEVNWTYMKENEIEPKQFIMFTDGYPCGGWGDVEYCDTVFLIHGNTDTTAPFGITVHYEEPNKIKQAA